MKPLFSLLSPAGPRGRLSTLILHRVLPRADELFPGEVDAERFDTICGWVRQWFNVLPLAEATQRMFDRSLPARAMAITFDDGYADNHDVAMPILRRHGLTATFFIATGYLDGGRMWNDTVIESVRGAAGPMLDLTGLNLGQLGALDISSVPAKRSAIDTIIAATKYMHAEQRTQCVEQIASRARVALPTHLMMSTQQVRAMRDGGMQVGAHTVTHPILARLEDKAAMQEMRGSRQHLEEILRAPVSLFAYPNGKPGADYSPRDVTLARECGFDAAFTTSPGAARPTSDPFQLPRYTPWRQKRLGFAAQLLRPLVST